MGQTRPVTVYRLLAAGTLDEHVAILAQQKLELDRALRGRGGGGGGAAGDDGFIAGDTVTAAAAAKVEAAALAAALLA